MSKRSSPAAQIVIVDDDPQMSRLLETMLRAGLGESVAVETYQDPALAQARLDAGQVDVVVTDLEMPALTGLEMLRYAKSRNASTQVVVVTGKSSHGALLDALEAGASDYLVKPIAREGLLEVVVQATQRVARWRRALAATWTGEKRPAAAAVAASR